MRGAGSNLRWAGPLTLEINVEYGSNFVKPSYPKENDIFKAAPDEIRKLREALGWSRVDLAGVLGVYGGVKGSNTVARWERGQHTPDIRSIGKMLQIVDMYRVEYLRVKNYKKKFKPHDVWVKYLEETYETSRLTDGYKVDGEGDGVAGEAVRAAERLAAKARRSLRATFRKRRRRSRPVGDGR